MGNSTCANERDETPTSVRLYDEKKYSRIVDRICVGGR